jgi:CubicO group peptidase (beta-lactamase class C family)
MTTPGERVTTLMRRPGKVLGVAVIEDFGLAWSRVCGGPPDTLFQAGSISKPVTALAALELAARSELDLDADVNGWLTGWQLPGPGGVSPRDLLGHTSGLGVPFYPGYSQGADAPTLRQSLDGAPPAATKPVEATATRGRFRYSGGGYTVIQQLITDVTGRPFAEVAQDLVLGPLGMTSSTFAQPLPADLRRKAARPDWHVYPESAAAGLWTTAEDLARFACAIAAAGAAAGAAGSAAGAGRGSPVGPDVAAQLLSARTAVPVRGEFMILPLLGMARPQTCGLGMFGFGDGRFGHIGGASSFFSVLVASAKDGGGAVVMTASNPSPFVFRLLRAISAERGWTGFRPTAWPGRPGRGGRAAAAGAGRGV